MNKPTVHDIAKEAGVSLATVDRVLNARPGVRDKTIQRVHEAVERLGYVRDTYAANLARKRLYRLVFLVPDGQGQFLSELRASIEEAARSFLAERVAAKIVLVPSHDQMALTRILTSLRISDMDGLAIIADETPMVRDTIARLKAAGVPVVSLVSDQPKSERDHFVGIDGVAGGRTAGSLIGRFVGPRRGKVMVVATSMLSHDMVDRRRGFDEVLQSQYPNLEALPSLEAFSDPDRAEQLTRAQLAQHPDAVALYSVGASIEGIARVLTERQGPNRLICVDHELTPNSRTLLEDGILDAVINQNTGHLARSAIRVLMAKSDGLDVIPSQELIRIDIIMRENLPPEG